MSEEGGQSLSIQISSGGWYGGGRKVLPSVWYFHACCFRWIMDGFLYDSHYSVGAALVASRCFILVHTALVRPRGVPDPRSRSPCRAERCALSSFMRRL